MRSLHRVSALLLLLAPAAFADLSLTTTLNAGQNLNLDTGAVTSLGGDLAFQGTSITFGENDGCYVLGKLDAGGFALTGEATLKAFAGIYTKTPLTGANLAVGIVFAVYTNATHYAKVLITASSTTSITLQFTTYAPAAAGPVIKSIQNNYSNISAGLPNYGIAPSTLFVIYGTGLASPTAQAVLQDSVAGIPTTLNGASIAVTVNGVTTQPTIYYAIASQIAAVLPASTPIGTGTITVTYNNLTSAPATIQVVPSALGLDTLSGQPTGTAVATDPLAKEKFIFNFTTSAKPGQIITLWGSGLGADPADSDTVFTSPPHPVNVGLIIYIGGIQAQIQYAGSSGYPGLVQINVTIPPNVVPGCGVPIVGVVGNVVSNTVTLPIAPNGGVCNDPFHGIDGTGIQSGINQTSLTSGVLAIALNTVIDKTTKAPKQSSFVAATYLKETNLPYIPGYGLVTEGGCIVINSTPPQPTISYLAAGNMAISGPGGTLPIPQTTVGSLITYELNLPDNYFPSTGGTFTMTASGSADVKPFSVTVADTNPLVWTNQAAITAVDRTKPVTVNWTGGVPGTYVQIGGGSTVISTSATFLCIARVEAGTFTIPSYVLLASPVGSGGINLLNQSIPALFPVSGLGTTFAVAETESAIDVPFN